ncbi:hypothetical protein C2E23DRAFT_870645 [Lenzites betulinus]|nr:hypothetical protein C2E23DRAFT_870645 [Lenzites betulinus]
MVGPVYAMLLQEPRLRQKQARVHDTVQANGGHPSACQQESLRRGGSSGLSSSFTCSLCRGISGTGSHSAGLPGTEAGGLPDTPLPASGGPSCANTPGLDDPSDTDDDSALLLNYVLDLEACEFVPAFREHADIRHLYLQVILANVFSSATIDESEQCLRDGLDLLALSSEGLPTHPKLAETLVTAKKCLGLNVDDYLFKRAICSECFKPYKDQIIANSASPACVIKKRPGIFYWIKHDDYGQERRVPAKVHTYLGKPPLQDDEDMHNFHDGTAYGAYKLEMKRVVMSDDSTTDIKIRRGPQRMLMSVDIRISMTINVDWYGVTEGHPHSNTPGPKEPSNEQIIHVIEPLYKEAKELYSGILLAVARRKEPTEVYGGVKMRICDLPGLRNLKAAAAYKHKACLCFFCKITHEEINTPAGYDVENFELHENWKQIANAFAWCDAKTKKECKWLFEEHLVNIVGIAEEMYMVFLVQGQLLSKPMWRKLKTTVNLIQWPSRIGHLPTNLGENHGFAKADQWRRWVNIHPSLPELPSNAKNIEEFTRDLREIYEIFLFASVSERILASKSISMEERMLELGIHLLPNHHLAMHYPDIFCLFGPIYAWWLYAHERFNGIQEKVQINSKACGEIELMLTRNWVAKQRLFELLSTLPESASANEHKIINCVILTNTQLSGTLRTHMFACTGSYVKVPSKLLLTFLKQTWPERCIANEFNLDPNSATFSSTSSACLFPVIAVNSTRFGSSMDKRLSNDHFGCVDFKTSQIPCKILYHFALAVPGSQEAPAKLARRAFACGPPAEQAWNSAETELLSTAWFRACLRS